MLRLLLVLLLSPTTAWVTLRPRSSIRTQLGLGLAAVPHTHAPATILECFDYQGSRVTYRYLPASNGQETSSPILLIHPVGIGLASWFWEPLLQAFAQLRHHPAVYAVNLLGCGLEDGSSPLPASLEANQVPSAWIDACQALIEEIIRPRHTCFWLPQRISVVTQGGLAPIGLALASDDAVVDRLVMCSPPAGPELTNAVPREELQRNTNVLQSPLGALALSLLETRSAVRFFSNTFLFAEKCDEQWLDEALQEARVAARPPVVAFNAGWTLQESWLPTLEALAVPVLILNGLNDTRDRADYDKVVASVEQRTIEGKNVLPWESPAATAAAILDFLQA